MTVMMMQAKMTSKRKKRNDCKVKDVMLSISSINVSCSSHVVHCVFDDC